MVLLKPTYTCMLGTVTLREQGLAILLPMGSGGTYLPTAVHSQEILPSRRTVQVLDTAPGTGYGSCEDPAFPRVLAGLGPDLCFFSCSSCVREKACLLSGCFGLAVLVLTAMR